MWRKNFNIALVISAKVDQALRALHQFSAAMTASAKSAKAFRESAAGLAVVGGTLAGASAAIALPLKASLSAFISEQAELAHMATAMNDGAQTMQHLNEVQAETTRLSQQGVISVEALGAGYYIARSNMLGHAQALEAVRDAQKLTTATTTDATMANREMASTARTLTSLYVNFGGSLSDYADQLTRLQTSYAFADISEVNYALSYAARAAKAAGVSIQEMNASRALLSAGGLHGAEAGTAFQAFVSKLTTDTKLAGFIARTREGGIDVQRTLQGFAETFGNMSPLIAGPRARGTRLRRNRYSRLGDFDE